MSDSVPHTFVFPVNNALGGTFEQRIVVGRQDISPRKSKEEVMKRPRHMHRIWRGAQQKCFQTRHARIPPHILLPGAARR
jgi:hypothetical protein